MSEYISQSFQDRIELSLANISNTANDKYSIVGMKYVFNAFKCELCGHYPCLYAFTIKNNNSGVKIDVGSECVKHFKGECDINVAEGLKKRVKSVTRKMRRYLKNSMEDDAYKNLTREEKRDLTIKLFMRHQNKEALRDQMGKKTRLTKDEVKSILEENGYDV
jgi:hypothetical protein